MTTTLDGLWILQVLCGIETLSAELGLRPHLPSAETPQMALAHPIAEELRRCGAITPDGEVDGPVREWLTVLSRRDAAILLRVQRPNAGCDRILMARLAHWWVILERCDQIVRLSAAGMTSARESAERSAGGLISAELERVCGQTAVAETRSLTLDVDDLIGAVADARSLRRYLLGAGLDGDQIAVLTAAADPARSTHTSVVALPPGRVGGPGRPRVEPGALTIIDSPRGRVLCEQRHRGGKRWMLVGPGSSPAITTAVRSMLHRLPSGKAF